MNYVSFGYGEKAFIVLPGLSDGLTTVKGKALLLAGSYREFFKEYTVYMFSRKNEMPEGYSIREMAADQAKALKELGIENVSVMGVSQGGMIAQVFAIDYPEMVEKLVVVVSAPRANERIQENVRAWIELALQGDHKNLMIDTAEKGYSEAYLKKYRKLYPVLGMVGKPRTYDRFFRNAEAILAFDAYEELYKIECPTFIIGGETDNTVGVNASYELKENIKHSEIHIYPGLGHAAYEEAKDFYDRVYEFLIKESF
jgi:pimeloyl-ACP methyl ester carboxylesterase